MRWSQDWGCHEKTGHETRDQAKAHMNNIIAKGGSLLNVYWCWWCEKYHVGHRPKGKKGNRRKRRR